MEHGTYAEYIRHMSFFPTICFTLGWKYERLNEDWFESCSNSRI